MRSIGCIAVVLLSSALCLAVDLPRSTLESQGISSSAVLSFIDAADKIDSMNSFMLLRHGNVVAEG